MSAVAADEEAWLPGFTVMRSRLPNTSLTKSRQQKRQLNEESKKVIGKGKSQRDWTYLLQRHLCPKSASHPSVPRRRRRRADQGSTKHRTAPPAHTTK